MLLLQFLQGHLLLLLEGGMLGEGGQLSLLLGSSLGEHPGTLPGTPANDACRGYKPRTLA